jgi:YD repeat-containing protein
MSLNLTMSSEQFGLASRIHDHWRNVQVERDETGISLAWRDPGDGQWHTTFLTAMEACNLIATNCGTREGSPA